MWAVQLPRELAAQLTLQASAWHCAYGLGSLGLPAVRRSPPCLPKRVRPLHMPQVGGVKDTTKMTASVSSTQTVTATDTSM